MRIDVNFAAPSPWRTRRASMGCLAIGALAAAAALWLGWQAHAEQARWHEDLQALRQSHAPQPVALGEDDRNALQTELTAANRIAARLNTPWAALFGAVERVYSDNAILLGLEPDPEARSVRMTAEAKDTDTMLDFVRQLRASKVFADAYVTNHTVNQQDVQHPIRFAIVAHWLDVPAGEKDGGEVEAATAADANASTVEQPAATSLAPGSKVEAEGGKP